MSVPRPPLSIVGMLLVGLISLLASTTIGEHSKLDYPDGSFCIICTGDDNSRDSCINYWDFGQCSSAPECFGEYSPSWYPPEHKPGDPMRICLSVNKCWYWANVVDDNAVTLSIEQCCFKPGSTVCLLLFHGMFPCRYYHTIAWSSVDS